MALTNQTRKRRFEFVPVFKNYWDDLEDLFKNFGNPNYCWCMRWRMTTSEFRSSRPAERKERLRALVQRNVPIGLLAFSQGKAVGWCSVAPRETFPALERSRFLKRIDQLPTWSITCFFVDPAYRGLGLVPGLLKEAVVYGLRNGAVAIEGYPVEPGKTYGFMGDLSSFETAGFAKVGEAGNGRRIYRFQKPAERA